MKKLAWLLLGVACSAGAIDSGYVTTAAPTYTDSTPAALSIDTSGNLRVISAGGGGGGGTTQLLAGEAHVGEVGTHTAIATGSTTTPSGTTVYASGNLIANSATAGSVTPISLTACRVNTGTGMIRRVRVKSGDTGFASASIRVHLYQLSPTTANGDHSAWSTNESGYLGAMDVTFDKVFTDSFEFGIGTPNNGGEINFSCASGSQIIYALLEARSSITPVGAKTFSLELEVLEN